MVVTQLEMVHTRISAKRGALSSN